MKKHNNDYRGAGKEVWRELERITAYGHSRHKVFSDWLDLMLNAHLSFTDNVQRYGLDVIEKLKANNFDGIYEERYLKTVRDYANDKPQGNRPMDHFTKAVALLAIEVKKTGVDVLGDIFMNCISFGEHGQFFTPESITEMMVKMTGIKERETVYDPACGSGRFLISAHKENPKAVLYGADLDERCARMCVLNMLLFGCDAVVYCGDSLAMKFSRHWRILPDGMITESEVKEAPPELGQGELPLAV